MAKNKYSVKLEDENFAKALGRGLKISTKQSIEICNFARKKDLQKVKDYLNDVIGKKRAMPFKRFNGDVGHKKKIGPGRYPVKACSEILKILASAEANAQFKGMNTGNLVIDHISAQRGAGQWRYGRQRRRKSKLSHIEVALAEGKAKKSKASDKAGVSKEPQNKDKIKKPEVTEDKSSEPQAKPEVKENKKEKVEQKKVVQEKQTPEVKHDQNIQPKEEKSSKPQAELETKEDKVNEKNGESKR